MDILEEEVEATVAGGAEVLLAQNEEVVQIGVQHHLVDPPFLQSILHPESPHKAHDKILFNHQQFSHPTHRHHQYQQVQQAVYLPGLVLVPP